MFGKFFKKDSASSSSSSSVTSTVGKRRGTTYGGSSSSGPSSSGDGASSSSSGAASSSSGPSSSSSGSSKPFEGATDAFGRYFNIPVSCVVDFEDLVQKLQKKTPSIINSVSRRKGQAYKVTLRKPNSNNYLLQNLCNFLCGGAQWQAKGYRMADLYYARRSMLYLLVKSQDQEQGEKMLGPGGLVTADSTTDMSPSSSAAPAHDEEEATEDEAAVVGGVVLGKGEDEVEREIDVYASIRRALDRSSTQMASNCGHYPGSGSNFGQVAELAAWLENVFADRIQEAMDSAKSGLISFDALEHLYRPGDFVYGYCEDTGSSPLAMRIVKSEYRVSRTDFGALRTFQAETEFVVSTGEDSFVCVPHRFTIREFLGRLQLDKLDWRPLPEPLRDVLAERGRKYASLSNGHHFMAYASSGFSVHRFSTKQTEQVVQRSAFLRTTGRVMLDTGTAQRLGHFPCGSSGWTTGVGNSLKSFLSTFTQNKQAKEQAAQMSMGYDNGTTTAEFDTIPEYFLPLAYPAIAGFSFTSKTWGHCLVESVSEIHFNESAFDQLVMAPSRKALIRALVVHTSELFSDIIEGKGSSTIFLLHGPPGSGKTLSAESISESLHKPLYSITMGELGVTPESLEERIQEVLQLASLWGCLVLIDEADVIVERRNTKDLKRNALVGILLRQLEYFSGVLFLTSNRVEVFDEAVHSRVTIALKYKPLSRRSRLEVWNVLLRAAGTTDIDPTPLAAYRLNGRQIKNSIRLAQALAKSQGAPLSILHLQHTISVSNEFFHLLQHPDDKRTEELDDSESDSDDPIALAYQGTGAIFDEST